MLAKQPQVSTQKYNNETGNWLDCFKG